MIGYELTFGLVFFLAGLRWLAQEHVDSGKDVGAVSQFRNAEPGFEKARHLDRCLVGRQMTDLVGQHAGQLIFALHGGDQFPADINSPARYRKRIDLGRVVDAETVPDPSGRKRFEQPLADARELVVGSRGHDPQPGLEVFRQGVTQVLFLAVVEDVGFARCKLRGLQRARRGGRGLCGHLQWQKANRQCQRPNALPAFHDGFQLSLLDSPESIAQK